MNAISARAGAQGDVRLQATLRFATGITLAFVVSEAMQWTPTFLAPALTTILLTNLPSRPPLKTGLGLVIVMTVTSVFAFAMASLLRGTPTVLFGLIGLCIFLAFRSMLSGRPPLPAMLLLICLATIPVLVLVAPAQAGAMPLALIRSMVVAVLTIWLVYLPWPLTPPPKPAAPATPVTNAPVAIALAGVAVVMPLMLIYLLFGLADVLPVMVATVLLVANFDLNRGRMHALGMIVGNFAGGMLGLLLNTLLLTMPSLPFLAGMLFVVLLGFGQRISAGGPSAGVAVLACNATLIILSASISSDDSSLSLWLVRVLQFALAGVFAIGMMTLFWHLASRERPAKHSPAHH